MWRHDNYHLRSSHALHIAISTVERPLVSAVENVKIEWQQDVISKIWLTFACDRIPEWCRGDIEQRMTQCVTYETHLQELALKVVELSVFIVWVVTSRYSQNVYTRSSFNFA
jgi:hypothetical protein